MFTNYILTNMNEYKNIVLIQFKFKFEPQRSSGQYKSNYFGAKAASVLQENKQYLAEKNERLRLN